MKKKVTKFVYNDGGRRAAGFKGHVDDCVARAIAIVTGLPYKEVYDEINRRAKRERCDNKIRSSARKGVSNRLWRKYCEDLGMEWVPTMGIGTGCLIHARKEELPRGKLILSVSGHVCAFINGELHDTHSDSLDKCVYGYFIYRKR